MRILQRAPQSYPRSACPVPAQRIAHHFPRHRALRLHRESASGCRAAEDFGERHEFAVLDDATRTTAREQSAEVRGLQLYPISRTGQRARGERRSNGRKDVWLGCFSAGGTLTGCTIEMPGARGTNLTGPAAPSGLCQFGHGPKEKRVFNYSFLYDSPFDMQNNDPVCDSYMPCITSTTSRAEAMTSSLRDLRTRTTARQHGQRPGGFWRHHPSKQRR